MLPFVTLLTASLIWGATAPIMKWALEVLPPFTLAFLRFFMASAIMLPFFWKFRKIEMADFGKIFLAALLGITLNVAFFFLGLKLTFAINAALIIATIPIFTMVTAGIFLKETLTLRLVFSTVLAFSGLILIIGPPIFNFGGTHLLGAFFLLLASLSWVAFEIVSKKLFKKYQPFTVVFHITWIGAALFLPMAAAELISNPQSLVGFNKQALIGILYGAIFSSTVAYTAWQWGLSKLPTSEAGLFLYLEPISAILVSIWLLGETITPLFVAGSLLVIFGVIFAESRRKIHPLHQSAT